MFIFTRTGYLVVFGYKIRYCKHTRRLYVLVSFIKVSYEHANNKLDLVLMFKWQILNEF